jgi:GntR family transcriptional regulator, transcriptional repressor for pyruvate dehydrogenase complex
MTKELVSQVSDDAARRDAGPLPRSSLVDRIVERLKEDIFRGRYGPGRKLLPERELAATLGVTRVSLKHALGRLEQLGLIRTRHGVGSVVQDYESSAGAELLAHLGSAVEAGAHPPLLEELLEVRTLMVGAFVRLAARRRKPKHVTELQTLIAEIGAKKDDIAEVQRLENEIIRVLARASHNRPFVFLTNSVSQAYKTNLEAYRPQFTDGTWVAMRLGQIVDAVVGMDEEGARRAAEMYFEQAARRVLSKQKSPRKR